MSKSKKKPATTEFTSAEVQESANILFDNVLEKIKEFPDFHIIKNSEENQKDRGIDFQIELVQKSENKTTELLKIQNKGTSEALKTLTKGNNKGLFSFQVSNRHIRYYRHEFSWPMIFTICDLEKQKIYWHAIQLDENLDERVKKSLANKHESIQIYIDPKKELRPDTFKTFIDDVDTSRVEQFFRVNEEQSNPLTDIGPIVDIDETKPVLDQIFELMESLYAEVQYLPIHLLTRNIPFKISDSFTPYFHSFKVYTDNEDLVSFFSSVEVMGDGEIRFHNEDLIKDVENYEEKTKAVLKKFSQNHIYGLISNKSRKEASTKYFSASECDCVACRYFRLDFAGSIAELEKPEPDELIKKLKNAYMHYQLGNYLKAAKLLEKSAQQAKEEQKDIMFLITQYNLMHLGQFIKNNYYDFQLIEYGRKLEEINLDKIVFNIRNKTHTRKMALWIKEQKFFYQQSHDIHSSSSKLRNEYQGHVAGGRGFTHNYSDLVHSYAQLNSFVNGNYIMYDKYSEYKAQTEEFIEGLFVSLAMKDHQGNMPNHLIDYHVQRLIFDGDHLAIWRYFKKYHLKPISYRNDGDASKFTLIVRNLLQANHQVKSLFQRYSSEEGGYWRNHYPSIFCNTMAVAAIIEMPNDDLDQIAGWIMDCLSSGELHSPDCYSQINHFLEHKMEFLNDEMIKKLLTFFVNQQDHSNLSRIEFLTTEAKKRSIKLSLGKRAMKLVFDISFSKEHDNKFNTVVFLYQCVDKNTQILIANKITEHLRCKFDVYQYYYVSIFDIIPFESEFLAHFIKACFPNKEKYTLRQSLNGDEDNKYPQLNMLINLCFKNNKSLIELTDLNFEGFGTYYDWILNIETFDYSEFKIDWLDLYSTKFYHQEFKKHKILKDKLENYLRNNRDQRFERLYFDLYKS